MVRNSKQSPDLIYAFPCHNHPLINSMYNPEMAQVIFLAPPSGRLLFCVMLTVIGQFRGKCF